MKKINVSYLLVIKLIIIAASTCFLKSFSKSLTVVFKILFHQTKSNNIQSRYCSGINTIWTILKNTAQKLKFSIMDFFSKCDKIRRKLRIWSHLMKKSLQRNFIFCAVKVEIEKIYNIYLLQSFNRRCNRYLADIFDKSFFFNKFNWRG